jgi:pumilio RNA-binding family
MTAESPMRMMSESGLRPIARGENSVSSTIPLSAADSVAQELGMLLKSHARLDSLLNHKDVVPHRSGSAPPTVEGSIAARGGFLLPGMETPITSSSSTMQAQSDENVVDSEQELRSDPAYLAYYYSHINLNPRLPPPIVSRENYFLAQRLASGDLPDKKKHLRPLDDHSKRSLFSVQPVLSAQSEVESAEGWESSEGSLLRQVSSSNWMEQSKAEAGSSSATLTHGFGARPKSLVDLIQVRRRGRRRRRRR